VHTVISPSPLEKRQAFTVTEEDIRYRNDLEENARRSSDEDPTEFPSKACSTQQQYKADLICTARVQPQLQTRATRPSPDRRRRKIISNITTGQARVCGTRRLSFENSWSRNQWVTRNTMEMTVHRKKSQHVNRESKTGHLVCTVIDISQLAHKY